MLSFSTILDKAPRVPQSRMVHSGITVWAVWSGQLDPAFGQMFQDYGGFLVAEDNFQSVWGFFGEEALNALARMQIWGRVNKLSMSLVVMPASILIGPRLELTVGATVDATRQKIAPAEEIEIWIHPNLKAMITATPGLSTIPAPAPTGLMKVAWELLDPAPGLSYDSGLGWYFITKPLGDPLDKNTSEGWRTIYGKLQKLLERMGIKYVAHEGFILYPLEGLRQFKTWCREILVMIASLRDNDEEEHKYWPSVMAAVPKKGFSFAKDLPRKINLNWDKLTPDFPHMSYRSAFLLGRDFKINDARYASRGNSVEDWCNVRLAAEGDAAQTGTVPIDYPAQLVSGDRPICFYCGLTNHDPAHCPSKGLGEWNPGIWNTLAQVDITDINEQFKALDTALAGDTGSMAASLLAASDTKALLFKAAFEVNFASQLRMMEAVWRSKGKDLPGGLSQLAPREGDFLWQALDNLRAGNVEETEKFVSQALTRYTRGYHPRAVQGFLAMESGDWVKTAYYWQEAVRLSYTALQRACFLFLQARAMEVQGDFQKAIGLYKLAAKETPRWVEPEYRQGVCMVKMGFTDQGMSLFAGLMAADAAIFNKVLVDPELERGRIHVLAALWRPWNEAGLAAAEALEGLEAMSGTLAIHFPPEDAYLKETTARIQALAKLGTIKNYVAYKDVVTEVRTLREAIAAKLDSEIKNIQARRQAQFEELKSIQREAAWFPFPKLLKDFNRDFNFCAAKLNWMRTTTLNLPENFRKSQEALPFVDERIKTLRSRLVSLRIVRDSTFFTMLLGRNFMWMEIAGLAMALLLVPLFVYGLNQFGQGAMADMVERQKWQLQKGLVIVLSIMAMGLAAIKTAITFDSKKRKLFQLADEGKLPAAKKKKGKAKKSAKPATTGKDAGKKAVPAASAKTALPPGKAAPAAAKPGAKKK
ncbi:tetratricopeptide repeat protein [Desulfolutivibrio sulfodismutans]|uniref:tetratricopeptide repeat protein n=1 Tax=Desulfolutivibrio sulfodismutans TaxID=63561 RepID=UPI00159DA786|nr:tetratricopeptide repeat protein [Desulfolutivibrio sulfodismutans]